MNKPIAKPVSKIREVSREFCRRDGWLELLTAGVFLATSFGEGNLVYNNEVNSNISKYIVVAAAGAASLSFAATSAYFLYRSGRTFVQSFRK